MAVRKEFRINLPNEPGQLAHVCEALCERGINIRTLAGLAGTPPVVALITDLEDETRQALQDLKLEFHEIELLAVKFENIPGEIGSFARKLADAKINIDAIYMLGESQPGRGMMAFAVSDLEKAKQILAKEGKA